MTVRWSVVVAGVGVLALIVGLAVMDRYHVGVFHDDAMYVILAKSLAGGDGYRYLNLPGAPSATHFPPGYPFVLSLMWRMFPGFPTNLVVFKAFNALCLAASAMLVMQLVRERLGSVRLAVVAGATTAVSVPLLVLSTMLLSEMLFLALLLGILVLAERRTTGEVSIRAALLLGCLVGVSALVRTHGIVLVPALAIPLLLQRRGREAAVLTLGALLVIVPWQLWSTANAGTLPAPLEGNYGSYLGWWMRGFALDGMPMLGETISRTVPETTGMLTSLFSPLRGTVAHAVTLVLLGIVFVAGSVTLASRAAVTGLFLAGYMTIVLIWPFPPSRFVWGVWPLLIMVFVAAASAARADVPAMSKVGRAAVWLALAWCAVGYTAYEIRATRGAWWASISRAADRRIAPAIAWTLANTARGDIVAADDEGAIFLYTGRLAVPVASFTTHHYLRERSAIVEASEGLVPILSVYGVSSVIVGSQRTFASAQYLTTLPTPLLALRAGFDAGAAYSVLK